MRKMLFLLLCTVILFSDPRLPIPDLRLGSVYWSLESVCRAEYYSPTDSVPLTIGTVSIGSDSVQDCDSVRIKWWWLSGGWTYVGTKKLTSSVESGFYATNIKASDASDHTGNYIAKAVAYKFGGSYTDIKTWSWTVAETFDSLTNAITNANKANFKADVSDLLSREDSTLYMRTDWSNIKNQSASVNLTQTRILGVDQDVGYLAGDDGEVVKDACADAYSDSGWTKLRAERLDSLLIRADSSLYMRTDWSNIKNQSASVNLTQTRILGVDQDVGYLAGDDGEVVKDACADAYSDSGWTKLRAERLDSLLIRADSSLYMRTDWNNIKNQDAVVNFTHTRLAFVDTVDSIIQTVSASCDTESIARSTWNDDVIPKAERRIQYVDSLGEEISASVDTSQIKAMNEANQWGAYYIWNYSTRTLTSGAGAGANLVVIRCKQSSDSSSIAFAQIQVLDSTETSTIGLLTSDSQGRGFFALDNGIYCVRLYKPGWQFTVPETLCVAGDEDTTYYAEAFDPGSPPQASLCRVYGWVFDINDQPMVGTKIKASIKTVPLRYQNVVISPYYKSAVTDDDGYWYLDLYPNSVLSPSDTKYIFHIFSPSGTILRLKKEVPNQTSWELQW